MTFSFKKIWNFLYLFVVKFHSNVSTCGLSFIDRVWHSFHLRSFILWFLRNSWSSFLPTFSYPWPCHFLSASENPIKWILTFLLPSSITLFYYLPPLYPSIMPSRNLPPDLPICSISLHLHPFCHATHPLSSVPKYISLFLFHVSISSSCKGYSSHLFHSLMRMGTWIPLQLAQAVNFLLSNYTCQLLVTAPER